MGALRRAGVWLGLIEDDQDRDSFYDDEFVEDEDFAVPARPRAIPRPTQRRGERDYPASERAARRDEPDDRFERDLHTVARDRGRDARERELQDRARDLRLDRQAEETDRLREERAERPPMSRQATLRLAEARDRARTEERPPVRPVRPTAGSTALSVPAQDGLTLAPPVQLGERAAASDDRLTRRYEITTLHPTGYSEARAIGEQFRDGHPVIMNLTDLAEADAKRLVDFAAGLAFGLRGSMERVTNRVFLLTPPNVRVSDEDRQRISEPGFFDQR